LGALAAVALVALLPATWAASWPAALAPMRAAEAWSRSFDGMERALPPNDTAIVTFYGWHWAELEHPDYVTWVVAPIWNRAGGVAVEVAQAQHGREDRPHYANALDGPDDPPHPIPPGIRRVLVMEGNPGGGADVLRPGFPTSNVTLPSGRVVRVFDTAGLASIEAATPWFDERGRLK
jgi:hypothetical protein